MRPAWMRPAAAALAAVVLLGLPAAAVDRPVTVAPPAVTVVGSPLEAGDALVSGDADRAVRASLVALGADRAVVDALAEGAVGEQLLPAPDLDGDGLPDVVGLGRLSRPGQSLVEAAELMTVTGRSGLTGETLWSVETFGATGMVVAEGEGLLVVTVEGSLTPSLHLTALDLDGTVRWQRSERGAFAGSAAVGWPLYRGTLAATDGGVRHLVQLVDYSYVWGDFVEPGRVVARVHDDADGAVVGTLERSGDGVPWAWAVPDLDGDGADDVLITQAFAFGQRGTVVALTVDGDELWETEAPFRSNGFLVPAGDATGDGTGDIAIGAGTGSVALLRGADGGTAWERPGDWPAALGDHDDDGLGDVGVRFIRNVGFSELVAEHAAYTGAGAQLYHTQVSIPIDPGRGYSSTTTVWLDAADVDGDGHGDTFHSFDLTYSDGERLLDRGATSGAHGGRLWDGPIPLRLDASVQGPGLDLVDFAAGTSAVFVEALRGDDRSRIWRVGVPRGGNFFVAGSAAAVDLDGDGAGEVLATIVAQLDGGAHILEGWVLDGHDGSVRWDGGSSR